VLQDPTGPVLAILGLEIVVHSFHNVAQHDTPAIRASKANGLDIRAFAVPKKLK
jgi:hypothetical protein